MVPEVGRAIVNTGIGDVPTIGALGANTYPYVLALTSVGELPPPVGSAQTALPFSQVHTWPCFPGTVGPTPFGMTAAIMIKKKTIQSRHDLYLEPNTEKNNVMTF